MGNYDEFLQILEEGWNAGIWLPEFETVEKHGGAGRGVATGAGVLVGGLAGGVIGYALSSGTRTQQKQISAIIRTPENGIVVEQAAPDNSDLRISWEEIINAYKDEHNGALIYLNLVNGIKLNFTAPYSGNWIITRYTDEFINYVNERACGKVEDGW